MPSAQRLFLIPLSSCLCLLLFNVHGSSANPPTEASPALRQEMQRRLDAIGREALRLRAAGHAAEADKLEGSLRHFQDRLKLKDGGSDEPELYVVGLYQGDQATVELEVADRPVVLALCSYGSVRWSVRLGQGVRLQKVILAGYYQQQLMPPLAGVAIENHATKEGHFYAYSKDEENYSEVCRRLLELTRLPVSAFQGDYAFTKPFVIGPRNRDWSVERVLSESLPVYHAATAFERTERLRLVSAVRFQALHATKVDRNSVAMARATFTPNGPITATLEPLPAGVTTVAVDPKGPSYYGLALRDVFRLSGRSATKLALDPSLPTLSWPDGLTFDTRRRRLVLVSLGGEGYMYACDVAADKWSLLCSLNNLDLASFTYAAEEDCFYGLNLSRNTGPAVIYQFSSAGELRRRFELPEAKVTKWRPGRTAQLSAAGRLLALTTAPEPDLNVPGMPLQSRCYLIDPAAAQVIWSGPAVPHQDEVKPEPLDLDQLWQKLLTAEGADAELLTWRRAARGQEAVEHVRKNLAPLAAPDPKRLEALIRQLDDNQFAVREAASAELIRIGDAAVAALARAEQGKLPLEVTARIRGILRQIEIDQESNADSRALRVLTRIGPPAAPLLRELSQGPEYARRTRLARAAMELLP